mgnify:FL=1
MGEILSAVAKSGGSMIFDTPMVGHAGPRRSGSAIPVGTNRNSTTSNNATTVSEYTDHFRDVFLLQGDGDWGAVTSVEQAWYRRRMLLASVGGLDFEETLDTVTGVSQDGPLAVFVQNLVSVPPYFFRMWYEYSTCGLSDCGFVPIDLPSPFWLLSFWCVGPSLLWPTCA